MPSVVTVLEARVSPEREGDLRSAYAQAAAGPFPPGFIRSTLLHGVSDSTQWRIETSWQSQEALAAMRQAGKPRGLQIFEAAGANPTLSIFEPVAEVVASAGAA